MKHLSPNILLLNPWITDFSAYNFWIKPIGLLQIASILRKTGFRITLVDCLDLYTKRKRYGDGKFFRVKTEKPRALKSIPKQYSRYGVTEEVLLERLSTIEKPDVIGITSGMTYWYPGVFKIIEIVKNTFKRVPIILGGIYATLCYEHARKYSGADYVLQGRDEREMLKLISGLTHMELQNPKSLPTEASAQRGELLTDKLSYPAFDLYPHLDYVSISTSIGCPYRCTYCASYFLSDGYKRRNPLQVVEEIKYWISQYHIKNIAFYDDALLIEPSIHFTPMMKEIIRKEIQCHFHAPNALHIREIDEEVAGLLFRGGFKTIRLGLETSNQAIQNETGGKVDNLEFQKAIKNLKKAGYSSEEIGVYIMVGLPGQRVEEVEESIAYVKETGARPMLVEYSPIPHTPLFEKAKKMSKFDLENEPLFHNNSLLPCQWEGFTMVDYKRLKERLRGDQRYETI